MKAVRLNFCFNCKDVCIAGFILPINFCFNFFVSFYFCDIFQTTFLNGTQIFVKRINAVLRVNRHSIITLLFPSRSNNRSNDNICTEIGEKPHWWIPPPYTNDQTTNQFFRISVLNHSHFLRKFSSDTKCLFQK